MGTAKPVVMPVAELKRRDDLRIRGAHSGGLGDCLSDLGVTYHGLQVLRQNLGVVVGLVELLAVDPSAVKRALALVRSVVGDRPLFGDWYLGCLDIEAVEGAERGLNIPRERPLTDLVPTSFLRPGEVRLHEDEVQQRALDAGSPCYAPWGRDLAWRIFNNVNGEGDAFLATLDKKCRYVCAGDKDLNRPRLGRVVLSFYFSEQEWCVNSCPISGFGNWFDSVKLLVLPADTPS
jgi:hypothetical protein